MSDLAKAKIEFVAAGFLACYWIRAWIEGAQRLAIERERATQAHSDERLEKLEADRKRYEEEQRSAFREDVAAGVKQALAEERGT